VVLLSLDTVIKNRVVYENIELAQEYRTFDLRGTINKEKLLEKDKTVVYK
jgi:hypothetical protein